MGKKSLISSKALQKIETFIIILISFFLLYYFGKNDAPITEKQTEPVAKISSDIVEADKGTEVFFDSEIMQIEKKMVEGAKKSIRIATYTYSESPLIALLEQRKKEGINIRVAAGRNKDGHVPQFDLIVNTQKNGIYHPKFMVFDSKDVLISSSNISSDSSASNSAVLFRDVPGAAKILESEIEDVFLKRSDRRCEAGCDTEIGLLIFNPGKGCVTIKSEFIKAEKSIKAGIYTVTSKNPVITGIKNALKKGVPVSILVDNWKGDDGKTVNKKAFNYLSSKGALLKFDEPESENNSLFHHKFAVIDSKTTLFGSMNWTASGCYKNREIIVINKDPYVAEKFEKYFDTLSR